MVGGKIWESDGDISSYRHSGKDDGDLYRFPSQAWRDEAAAPLIVESIGIR